MKQQLAEARQYREFVAQDIRATNTEIARHRNLLVPPAEKAKAETDFKASRRVFLRAEADLRPSYDRVIQEYQELDKNDVVKNALKAHSQLSKANFVLGPSEASART